MKPIFLLLLMFGIPVCGTSQHQKQEQLVREAASAWFNSYNKHDNGDMPRYITEDCYII
jgi:hypothetical protein